MFGTASNFVQSVDNVFLIIIGISLFFLISFTAIMIYFIIRYNKKRQVKAIQVNDSILLEVTWTVIPLLLVLFMFYIGWAGFLPMRKVPKNTLHVKAIAKMWKWTFEYEGNKQSDTLVLPINKAVKIDLISLDVLHGFSIPAFRIKEDVVPYKKNYTWFIPGELGDYDLFCTVYCGLSHSYMYATVRIIPQNDFKSWLVKLPVKKAMESNKGYKILETNGCFACHSINGSKVVGPTFKGLYGESIEIITNGNKRKITVDDSYLTSSIYEPDQDIAAGYQKGIMKSYKGIITETDVQQINEYLKNLK